MAPAYYDGVENGFLKSFTVGFLTTCGLNAVGVPCDDAGERLPLHGTVGNIPAEQVWWEKDGKEIRLHAVIKDQALGAHKLLMKRTIGCSLEENSLYVEDVIENEGDTEYPAMILYHMNMGYPLLSEKSEIYIPSADVKPRTEHAAEDIDTWMKMLPPQPGFEEQCYFHSFDKDGLAAIYNPDIDQGLAIRFDPGSLPYFTEWKMMGVPGLCTGSGAWQLPSGRTGPHEGGRRTDHTAAGRVRALSCGRLHDRGQRPVERRLRKIIRIRAFFHKVWYNQLAANDFK